MKLAYQRVYQLPFIIFLFTCFFVFQSNAQHQSPCERFEKGQTRPNFPLSLRAVGEEQSLLWAKYYDGLQFTKKETQQFGSQWEWTELHSKPGKAGGTPQAIPIATGTIAQRYFSNDYIGKCQACKPFTMVRGDDQLPEKAKEMARKCREAAIAWRNWGDRINDLKRDMKSYCAGQAQSSSASNTNSNSNSTTSTNSSGNTSSYTPPSSPKPTSTYSQAKSQQSSYQSQQQSEYNRWKADQDRQEQAFNQRWQQIRSQNAQIERQKQQAMDQSLQRIASVINQIAEQQRREEEEREYRKKRGNFNRVFEDGKRRFERWQQNCRGWTEQLRGWFTTYGVFLDYKSKSKVESDLKGLRMSMEDSYEYLDKLYYWREQFAEDLEYELLEGKAKSLYNDFGGDRRIARVSSANGDLSTYVRENDTPRNRIMHADYLKIAYDYEIQVRKRESFAYYHAKGILEYFPDYPGANSMRALVARVDADRAERKKNEVMRRSLEGIPAYSSEGRANELKNLIDSLIMFGDRNAVAEAFLGKRTSSWQLERMIRHGGYHREFLNLNKWLPYQKLYERYSHQITESYIVARATDLTLSASGSGMGYDNGNLYRNQRLQHRLTLRALIDPTEANIKAVIKEYKNVSKGFTLDVTWPQVMFCLMTENYKYLTNRRTSIKYTGLWTRSLDNHSNIEVTKVDKNSPADLNGIKVGDKITAIDGRSTKSMSSELTENYNTAVNFRGYHPRNKKKTSIRLEVIKADGKTYNYQFPISITKENIKNQFSGTRTTVQKEFSTAERIKTDASLPPIPESKILPEPAIEIIKQKLLKEGVEPPTHKKYIQPIYPRSALSRGIGGVVYILASIDENGKLGKFYIFNPDEKHRIFNKSAVRAMISSEFSPATKDGIPEKGSILLKYNFELGRD